MMAERASPAQRTLFVLLMASLVLVALIFRPLAVALFVAVVLAGALHPWHARLSRAMRGKPKVAAWLILVAVVLLIVGPLFALSAFVVKEAAEATRYITDTIQSEGVDGLVAKLPHPLEAAARKLLEQFPSQGQGIDATVQQQVASRGGQAAAAVGAAVAATGSLVFQVVMMLIALFFLLTQADAVMQWVDDASPLRRGQTRELMTEFRKVSVAVMRSSFLTAGVQSVAALLGYFIARVPHPLFFAAITFVMALVPAIGAAVVCLAAAVLLLATGHTIAAIFLAAWGLAVVGLADNVVKPLLIRGGVEMNGMVVFFSLLGGLAAFGTIGLLMGPLAVALFVALLRIYRRDYGEEEPPRPQPEARQRASGIGRKPQEA